MLTLVFLVFVQGDASPENGWRRNFKSRASAISPHRQHLPSSAWDL